MYFVSRRYGLGLKKYDKRDPISPSGGLCQAMMDSFPNSASQTPPAEKSTVELGLHTQFVGQILDVKADEEVLDAGARAVAVCTAIIAAKDIAAEAAWFKERLRERE
jgi:hypothetical protein